VTQEASEALELNAEDLANANSACNKNIHKLALPDAEK
jgi:hypothetical protein